MITISDLTLEDNICKLINIKDSNNIEYKLYSVSNVKIYDNKSPITWDIELYTDDEVKKANNVATSKLKISTKRNFIKTNYYFIIDTYQNEAFAHWTFESAVYLSLFIELKNKYPTLKLVLRTPRNYKKLFIKLFNISTDDIVYNIDINNICIFPSPVNMINDKELNDKFQIYARKLMSDINKIVLDKKKDIDILFMPRQSKENFVGNNRINDSSDIQYKLENSDSNYRIVHTDEVTNLKTQIETVKRSHNLIVTDGSPFLVNGLFCTNTNIIVLGNIVEQDGNSYKRYAFLKTLIEENNNVIMLPYTHGTFYNCKFLYTDIEQLIKK